jgi:hypothetical protein
MSREVKRDFGAENLKCEILVQVFLGIS